MNNISLAFPILSLKVIVNIYGSPLSEDLIVSFDYPNILFFYSTSLLILLNYCAMKFNIIGQTACCHTVDAGNDVAAVTTVLNNEKVPQC